MEKFTQYTTIEGDRLDTIAGKLFGNPHLWGPIIEHNPSFPLLDHYAGGIRIKIPIVSAQSVGIANNINLPLWKR